MGCYKIVKKWVPAYYKRINGKKVYVRGYYKTTKIYVTIKRNLG